MGTWPLTELSELFCSYCAYPPRGKWRDREHRVCRRCQLGVILRAPAEAIPRHDDPFVIVDANLVVQAVSRHAETVLLVDEPAGFSARLDELLISDTGDVEGAELARLVRVAVDGASPSETVELRTVDDPVVRFQVRLSSCGPPLAALLVLTPAFPGARPLRTTRRPTAAIGRVAVDATDSAA
jgi:hypothetical protein